MEHGETPIWTFMPCLVLRNYKGNNSAFKENDFLMFDFTLENMKENQI